MTKPSERRGTEASGNGPRLFNTEYCKISIQPTPGTSVELAVPVRSDAELYAHMHSRG